MAATKKRYTGAGQCYCGGHDDDEPKPRLPEGTPTGHERHSPRVPSARDLVSLEGPAALLGDLAERMDNERGRQRVEFKVTGPAESGLGGREAGVPLRAGWGDVVQVYGREAPPAVLPGGHVADYHAFGGQPSPPDFEFGCPPLGVHQGDVWTNKTQGDDPLRRPLGSPKEA
jgi:hypothetical protein